jgi:hypothetical protein
LRANALKLVDNGAEAIDMTIQIEIDPETEARLDSEARSHGVDPKMYAGSLLRDLLNGSAPGSGQLSVKGFREMLEALAAGSASVPSVPTDRFTRESFYEDRA